MREATCSYERSGAQRGASVSPPRPSASGLLVPARVSSCHTDQREAQLNNAGQIVKTRPSPITPSECTKKLSVTHNCQCTPI